jgi:hypothetical protein
MRSSHPNLRRPAACCAAALAIALAACGAADDEAPATITRATPAPTLLDDEGRVQALTAAPADPGARTRAGRYASAAQAADLERALGDDVIVARVEPGSDPAGAVDLAVLLAYAHQAAHDLDADAPVLVSGPDQRLAATLADRLEAQGFRRVFLVLA